MSIVFDIIQQQILKVKEREKIANILYLMSNYRFVYAQAHTISNRLTSILILCNNKDDLFLNNHNHMVTKELLFFPLYWERKEVEFKFATHLYKPEIIDLSLMQKPVHVKISFDELINYPVLSITTADRISSLLYRDAGCDINLFINDDSIKLEYIYGNENSGCESTARLIFNSSVVAYVGFKSIYSDGVIFPYHGYDSLLNYIRAKCTNYITTYTHEDATEYLKLPQ